MTVATKPHRNGKKPIQKPMRGVGRNPTLIPGNPGNRGGAKGRSGRKTLEFVAACSNLVDTEVLPKVEAYLQSNTKASDPAWRWCAEYVTGYGKGKPPQKVVVGGDEENPIKFSLALGDAHVGDD